jgi:hypothetical protein
MARNFKLYTAQAIAALALALFLLTLAPVASTSTSLSVAPRQGGSSTIHKNGDTPTWMVRAMARAKEGLWL